MAVPGKRKALLLAVALICVLHAGTGICADDDVAVPTEAGEGVRGKNLLDEGLRAGREGRNEEALPLLAEALETFRKRGDLPREANALIGIGIVHRNQGRYAEALKHFERALEIRRSLGNLSGEAGALVHIGIVHRHQGRYAEALKNFERALETRRSLGNLSGEAGALHQIGVVHYNQGRYAEALRHYEPALAIRRKLGDLSGQADSLLVIGNVHVRQGRYDDALRNHEQVLEIKRKIGDHSGEAGALLGIGNVNLRRGRYAEALRQYGQVLEIKRKLGDLFWEPGALIGIGNVHYRQGRYAEALRQYDQVLEIKRKVGDPSGEALALTHIGHVYDRLGRYAEALRHFGQALEIKRKIGDLSGEADALLGIANVHHGQGRYDEALLHYGPALEIKRKLGERFMEAGVLLGIGNVHYRRGRYSEALMHYEQVLAIRREIGDPFGEAFALKNMGYSYYFIKRYPDALRYLGEAADISERIGAPEIAWKAHRGLGKALRLLGRGEEAILHYQKAVAAIEELYRGTQGFREEDRSTMIGEKAHVYREFIELLLEMHRKAPDKGCDREVFLVSERSKSRVFQEMMAAAGARMSLSGDATFRESVERERRLSGEEEALRSQMEQEYAKPAKERGEEAILSLRDRLAGTSRELRALERENATTYPRYADLKRPQPLSVKELQGLLLPGETVVSYAVGEKRSAAFVVTMERFRMVELGVGREALRSLVREFRQGLEGIREYKNLETFRPEASRELYVKVFSPVEKEAGDPKILYISGDDALHTVPFESLVDREWDGKRFREARRRGRSGEGPLLGEFATLSYLGDRYAVSYLPSASVLRSLRKNGKEGYGRWERALVAFADPVFWEEDPGAGNGKAPAEKPGREATAAAVGIREAARGMSSETALSLEVVTRSTGGTELPRLKESGEEARAIARAVGGKEEDLYLREKATEENVFLPKLSASRYVLFSTHGLLGGDFTGVAEPSLVLTLAGNPPGRDGFLSMSKVLGLDMNADLAILSACNTSGKGEKAGAGEGFAGLTRSFMYAGARSLLVTHWSVESASARDLMVSALGKMKGSGKASALVGAKREMRGSVRGEGGQKVSLSHPFFWAPFVLVGEGQ